MVRLSLFLLLTISLFSWAQDLPESVEKSTVQNPIEDTLSDEKDVCEDPSQKDRKCDVVNPLKLAKDVERTLTQQPNIDEKESRQIKEYAQRANEIDSRMQQARKKILESKTLSTNKKRKLLAELEDSNKRAGTIATLTGREPFIRKITENGGAFRSEGKKPFIVVDGKRVINDQFGGTLSDYDLGCEPNCTKTKSYAIANGFEIIQRPASFDIVCKSKSCGDNDMLKITVNEPGASTRAKVGDKETYIHVQDEHKGTFSDKTNQGLKVYEHAFKGGTPQNSDQLEYTHKADETFNTSTKTAHKILQDAPEFIDDKVIEESIKKNNLRNRSNNELISVNEYKKMLSDAANKQTTKGRLSLDVNDMNAFLNVRTEFVKNVVTSVQTQQEVFLKNEEDVLKRMEQNNLKTPRENWTNQQKALQLEIDSRRESLNRARGYLDSYRSHSSIQKIVNPDAPPSISESIQRNAESLQELNNKQKQREIAARIKAGNVGKAYAGGASIVGVIDIYNTVNQAIEICKNNHDSSKCESFMKQAATEMGTGVIKDFVLGRSIPIYSQVMDSWEVGYAVGEQVEKYAGSILVEDCKEDEGKKECKQTQARNKYLQNPAKKFLTKMDGTEEVEDKASRSLQYIESCKQYTELLEEKNTTCVSLVSELEKEILHDDEKVARLEAKLSGLKDPTPLDDTTLTMVDNFKIPTESVSNTTETSNIAEASYNQESQWDEVDQIASANELNPSFNSDPSSVDQLECEDGWSCVDDLDGNLLSVNENAWQVREAVQAQANNQAESQNNQLISQSKEAGIRRAEQRRIAQAALAEGLEELATGLVAIQQQNAAMDANFEAQKRQIREQNNQTYPDLMNSFSQKSTQSSGSSNSLTSSEWAACNNSPYPITDPYACKAFLARGGVPQSYSGQNQNSIPVVKESLKKQGTCNDWLSSGSNEPEQYTVPLPPSYGGSYKFSYEFYDVKDRARVLYNGSVIHDTQCRSDSATIDLKGIRGGQVSIIVDPLCDPSDSNTDWKIKLECPVS